MTQTPTVSSRFSPRVPAGRRVYAIGDVHGHADLLHRLLTLIAADHEARGPAESEVVLLGDMIDRGPDSPAVLRFAMAGDSGIGPLKALIGNHEEQLLETVKGNTAHLAAWLLYGGTETLLSFGLPRALLASGEMDAIAAAAQQAIPGEVVRWLAALPESLRYGDYMMVHAGVRPGVPLAEQTAADLRWIRHEFLDSEEDHGAVVVHGHTIRDNVEIRHNRIGLDTGAYRSGVLSAIGLEGDQRWIIQTGQPPAGTQGA